MIPEKKGWTWDTLHKTTLEFSAMKGELLEKKKFSKVITNQNKMGKQTERCFWVVVRTEGADENPENIFWKTYNQLIEEILPQYTYVVD